MPRSLPFVRFLFCLAAVLALAFAHHVAAADELGDLLPELDKNAVWNIEADKAVSLDDGAILEASGDVVLRQGPNYLKADFARYHRETHWVYLQGNVRAGLGGDEMEAEEAEFDLNKQVGWLRNGRIFLADPHLYFSGSYVEKEWGETYSFKEAKVTACDGEVPAWSFEADSGKVTIDGMAKLKHARFNVMDTPVLYTPIFSMSTAKRHSGLLMPGVGYSNLLGAQINVPIYLVVNEENDITLYENLLTSRGFMQGLEYRHNWDFIKGKGYWRFDYMYDAEVALRESQEPSPLDEDGLVRTNHDRFWLRSMFNGQIPEPELDVKLDLDFVSDQNYLREFKSGLSGYTYSRDLLEEEFGRSINEIDQDRVSTLLVSRDWSRGLVAGMVQYTQPVDYGHGNTSLEYAPQLQKLPELSGYLYKDRLPGLENLPLELQADLVYTNYRRNYGSTGGRFDFHPKLSVPLESAYGAVIPSVGFRQTFYSIDNHEPVDDAPEGDTDNTSRSYVDVNVEAESEVYKVFDFGVGPMDVSLDSLGDSRWTAVKHSIQPRVSYNYIPDVDQDDNPFFDEEDRVQRRSDITYSLTNLVTRKREEVVMRTDSVNDPQPGLSIDYLDVFRLRLEQSYDFEEATRSDRKDDYERRPFSDILADATVRLDDWVSLNNKTWFSPYLTEFTEHAHTLILEVPNWVATSFGLDFMRDVDEYKRQERPDMSVLDLGLDLSLFGGWSVGAGYKADLENEKNLETSLGLSYKHQCFDIAVEGTTTPLEDRVEAWVNLTGISFF